MLVVCLLVYFMGTESQWNDVAVKIMAAHFTNSEDSEIYWTYINIHMQHHLEHPQILLRVSEVQCLATGFIQNSHKLTMNYQVYHESRCTIYSYFPGHHAHLKPARVTKHTCHHDYLRFKFCNPTLSNHTHKIIVIFDVLSRIFFGAT